MPLQPTPDYKPSLFFLGSHVETLYPYLFRNIPDVDYNRERIELPDDDFVDLDWIQSGKQRLIVLCHGLEGSSQSQYMKGMAKAAVARGFDVLSINFRSCSGEMNRQLRLYHHGEISDLKFIINQVISNRNYSKSFLCGFSLGGNVILKYLGTLGSEVPSFIKGAVAISVPCDLASSSDALDQWYNYLYTRRFMHSLKPKFQHKSERFPEFVDIQGYDQVRTWQQFDNKFTTQVTGFKNAEEYYAQGSANNFIAGIRIPTLIINALNDPFLVRPSYPVDLCEAHDDVYLEMPKYGGHVGFWFPWYEFAYTEKRALDFFDHFYHL